MDIASPDFTLLHQQNKISASPPSHQILDLLLNHIDFSLNPFHTVGPCNRSYRKFPRHSSFSIIHNFLPNHGRILPALAEKSKIKNCPYWGLNPQPPDHQFHTLTNCAKSLFGCLCQSLKPYKLMLY